jgi:hypothetical protein
VLALGFFLALALAFRAYSGSRASRGFRSLVRYHARQEFIVRARHFLDPQMRAFTRYWIAVKGLERSIQLRDAFETAFINGSEPALAAAIRQSTEYSEIDAYRARMHARCIAYFKSMREDEVQHVAALFCETHLENKVPVETLATFYRDERDMIVQTPHLAAGHMERAGQNLLALHLEVMRRQL